MPQDLKDVVLKCLDDIGMKKRSVTDKEIKYVHGSSDVTVVTKVKIDGQVLLIHSTPEFRVPQSKRKQCVEYVCRKNSSLKVGCLEMDIRDGEVRYRTGINFNGAETLSPVVVDLLHFHHGWFIKNIYPVFKKLADSSDSSSMEELLGAPATGGDEVLRLLAEALK